MWAPAGPCYTKGSDYAGSPIVLSPRSHRSMTSQQLLDLIDQRKLVPNAIVAKLRAQVADPRKRATPKALVKLLVDRGQLTPAQGQQLLDEALAAPAENMDDDLGFALIDDDPPPAVAAVVEKPVEKRPTVVPEIERKLAGKGSVREAWRVEDTPRPRDQQPSDDLLGDLLGSSLGPSQPLPSKRGRWPWTRNTAPRAAGDAWDSPLLLLGGGGLVALVLVGGFLYWRIGRGNADEWLEKAATAYRDQAYGPAAEQYAAFVQRFPSHDRTSFARVQAGLAQLRQATAGNASWPQALVLANEVVPGISGEQEFASARDELTALLPAISEGLAQQARQAADKARPELPPAEAKPLAAQAQARLGEARQSLTLVERYVPAAQRPAQRLRDVELLLATTARDIARTGELEATVAAIDAAVAKGDLNAAYEARRKLLREHPALEANTALEGQIRQLAAKILSTAHVTQPNRAATRQDVASPVLATATPWALQALRASTGGRQFIPVLADGTAYGVDGASGKLLWRRYVGAGATGPALPTEGDGGALLADVARNELVCLDRWTGAFQWRQTLEGRPFDPVLAGGTALVATAGSRLAAFEAASGKLLRETVLPQPPAAPPAAGAQRPHCYVVADHSNLYTIELASGACREVTYVGHELGSVRVAPALLLRCVVVAENHLTEASRLHVFLADPQGRQLELVQQIPLAGWVTTPLAVAGSRLVVATDRGGLYVFEAREQTQEPLVTVAERPATAEAPKPRFVAAREGRILVADDRLTLFELQPARGRLDPRWVEQPEMLALQAPIVQPGAAVYVSKPTGQASISVSSLALDKGGPPLWQGWLQPLAGEPLVSDADVTALGARGDAFSAGAKELSAGQQTLVATAAAPPQPGLWLTQLTRASAGSLVATSAEQLQHVLIVEPGSAPRKLRWLSLPELQPATPAACLGEGLLVADGRGQVHLLSLAGKRLAQPFQPPQAAGSRIEWRAPGIAESPAQAAVLSDGGTRLFRLTLAAQPQPRLVAAAAAEVVEPIVSPVAVVGATAYAFDAGGWLRSYALEDLRPKDAWHLNAQATWGPARCGSHVYASTDADELLCLDGQGQLAWRVPLEHGPLAGPPLETPQGVVLVSTRGIAWRVSASDGKQAARVELAQPAATGMVVMGNRWLVSGRDGSLLSLAPF